MFLSRAHVGCRLYLSSWVDVNRDIQEMSVLDFFGPPEGKFFVHLYMNRFNGKIQALRFQQFLFMLR